MIKKYNVHQNLEEWKCIIAENGITWVKCNLKYALDTFTTWVTFHHCFWDRVIICALFDRTFTICVTSDCDCPVELVADGSEWQTVLLSVCWTDLFSLTNRHAEVNHVSVHVSHRWNPEVPSKDRCKPELTQFTDPDRSLLLNQQSS